MKVVDFLNTTKETRFSFELLPPLKGANIKDIYKTIDKLMEFNPPFMNITYHREEVVYKTHKSGLLEKRTVHKRPGTVAIAAAIKYKYQKIDVVPHLICGGFSCEETENALIDLNFLGIHDLLVLRGDPMKSEGRFLAENNGHLFAIDLIKQIVAMNNGQYLDEELQNSTKTDFSIGIAGYPEKHVESPNMESNLRYLKAKVEAGAQYIVTQMFFDNEKYFSFVKQCRAIGINVPIIPGIKPIATKAQLNILPQTFFIDIPDVLAREIEKCSTNEAVRQLGVEWAIAQSRALIKFGAPVIHFFTMGKAENVRQIAKAVF